MGRGSNSNALEARNLLYGTRKSGSGPQRMRAEETPATLLSPLCEQDKIPTFLQAEFPDCRSAGGNVFIGKDEENISDGRVDLIGINDDGSEKSLGIYLAPEKSFYYFDDTCPIGKTVAPSLLPGNDGEKRLLRALADNSAPGQEIEFTIYRQEQLESLLDNYGDKDLRLVNPDNYAATDEISALDKIYDNHTLLEGVESAKLAEVRSLRDLLKEDGGKEILMSYFTGGNVLHISASLDKFRSN